MVRPNVKRSSSNHNDRMTRCICGGRVHATRPYRESHFNLGDERWERNTSNPGWNYIGFLFSEIPPARFPLGSRATYYSSLKADIPGLTRVTCWQHGLPDRQDGSPREKSYVNSQETSRWLDAARRAFRAREDYTSDFTK